jgi:RNA polymerase sigma-54 factor
VIKTFDPPGIGAAHLQESYLLQLRAKSYSLAELLIRDHFQDLVNSRFTAIQKKLRLTSSDLQETLHTLSRLPMHPAALFDQSAERPLIADLSIQELEDRWILHIGEEELPLIHLNTDYLNLFATMHRGDEKDTMKSWITSARWLQRCVKRRKDTLNRIGRLLIKTQTAFLQNTGELKPLGIDDLARYLNVHESTAWRAIAHKTLSCPQGLIPLQQFFSDSSKADGVKNLLKILINQEDKSSPYTDDDLVRELSQKGVACARRTIAKYRKLLKLGPAHQRKSLGT